VTSSSPAPTNLSPATEAGYLSVRNISVSYGKVEAVSNVSFDVPRGEVFALLGANGAGKSTIINTISGLLRPSPGEIFFDSKRLTSRKPYEIVGLGVCQVPEGRRIFASLTVEENLEVAGYVRRQAGNSASRFARVYDLFPRLGQLRQQYGGTLSGGEQQMLAIGRALMAEPKLLMLDEPSLGLAPTICDRIWETLHTLKGDLTVLLVEQNFAMALEVADWGAVLEHGSIRKEGPAVDLAEDLALADLYLGESLA
jgi:branched-chain amino acid transport system ATP-binding protein